MQTTAPSLLERLQDPADTAAWPRLAEVYRPWLLGWLMKQGLPESDAEDLVQEVLVVVLREVCSFQHNQRTGAFRAWLRTIAAHRLRDAWRRRRARPVAGGSAFQECLQQLEEDDSLLSQQWDREHDRHVVGRLLALLEPDFQTATWRAFRGVMLEGHSPAEVAARLHMSVNAVLLAKSRVLARLREEARGLVEDV